MHVLEKIESRERCAEAGWYAFDFLLEEKITREDILSLKPLGSFVYLPMLKKPFFKIESDYYMIKGVEGDDFFRLAVHDEHYDELERIESFVTHPHGGLTNEGKMC